MPRGPVFRGVTGLAQRLPAALLLGGIVLTGVVGTPARPPQAAAGSSAQAPALPACDLARIPLALTAVRPQGMRIAQAGDGHVVLASVPDPTVRCHLHAPLIVTLTDGAGTPLPIPGNPLRVWLSGALPSSRAVGGFGWQNWCGPPDAALLAVASFGGQTLRTALKDRPGCDSRAVSPLIFPLAAFEPQSASVSPGTSVPFKVSTPCGIDFHVDFAGRLWDLEGRVAALAPEPVPYHPSTEGAMTLVDADHARFDFPGGTFYFTAHEGTRLALGACDAA